MMQVENDPIRRFADLYEIVQQNDLPEPAAVILATASPEGKPSARVVLLKGFDEHGFVFYTNMESKKAKELRNNPHAALCFYWEVVHSQVRIQGRTEAVSDAEADEYFATRPRGSQIGAWASKQSHELPEREELLQRVQKYESKFAESEVARPLFWSGFRVIPERIEFWIRRENRLHDRTVYERSEHGWKIKLLYP